MENQKKRPQLQNLQNTIELPKILCSISKIDFTNNSYKKIPSNRN